ncbi:MAG TPA: TetR/AcrR family transcriptional regulator [Kofleriaceae bacterium]
MAKPKAGSRAPIWTRPAPGTRQPKLTRERIAEVALAIADGEGFAEVSMRRIALELGVGTMTLYYYVKTKDDLHALIDDEISGQMILADDELPRGWRAGLIAIAHRTRDVFVRHPWALRLLPGARVGPNHMQHIEQSLAVVEDAPVDTQGKLRMLSIVDDYVFGHVLRATETVSHPGDQRVMKLVADFFDEQIGTGRYPHIEAMLDGKDTFSAFGQFAQWMTEDVRFELGLSSILDGFEGKMAAGPTALSTDLPAERRPAALAAARPPRARAKRPARAR